MTEPIRDEIMAILDRFKLEARCVVRRGKGIGRAICASTGRGGRGCCGGGGAPPIDWKRLPQKFANSVARAIRVPTDVTAVTALENLRQPRGRGIVAFHLVSNAGVCRWHARY